MSESWIKKTEMTGEEFAANWREKALEKSRAEIGDGLLAGASVTVWHHKKFTEEVEEVRIVTAKGDVVVLDHVVLNNGYLTVNEILEEIGQEYTEDFADWIACELAPYDEDELEKILSENGGIDGVAKAYEDETGESATEEE